MAGKAVETSSYQVFKIQSSFNPDKTIDISQGVISFN